MLDQEKSASENLWADNMELKINEDVLNNVKNAQAYKSTEPDNIYYKILKEI